MIEECKNVTLVLGGEVPNVRIANCAGAQSPLIGIVSPRCMLLLRARVY
jgi:hypothetical protein